MKVGIGQNRSDSRWTEVIVSQGAILSPNFYCTYNADIPKPDIFWLRTTLEMFTYDTEVATQLQ